MSSSWNLNADVTFEAETSRKFIWGLEEHRGGRYWTASLKFVLTCPFTACPRVLQVELSGTELHQWDDLCRVFTSVLQRRHVMFKSRKAFHLYSICVSSSFFHSTLIKAHRPCLYLIVPFGAHTPTPTPPPPPPPPPPPHTHTHTHTHTVLFFISELISSHISYFMWHRAFIKWRCWNERNRKGNNKTSPTEASLFWCSLCITFNSSLYIIRVLKSDFYRFRPCPARVSLTFQFQETKARSDLS